MPNVIVRVARYLLRSRKRSASLQNSSTTASPQTDGVTPDPVSCHPTPKLENKKEPTKIVPKDSNGEKDDTKSKNDDLKCQKSRIEEGKEHNNSSKNKTNLMEIKMSSNVVQSTTVRSRRVLRELQVMMKASERSECPFEVGLVDESNIFEWDIRLLKVDETSDLWRSMQQTGTESIHFRLTFPELFPFQPPFLRLIGPYLDNGFIMDGGAICMEVLTNQGWSSAYTVESLLVQVASGLTQGGAVISHKQKRKYNQLTQKRAEAEFRRICKIHSKYGWVNMERDEI